MSIAVISRNGSKTGKELAEALGADLNPMFGEYDVIVRWGSTRNTNATAEREINSVESIAKAIDKIGARAAFSEAGVSTPVESEVEFPVVGRTATHRGGKGFFFCEDAQQVEAAKERGAAYFSKFYPKSREIRVHVAGGKTILVSEKEGDKSKHIWNKQRSGFTLRHLHRTAWLSDPVLRAAQRAAKQAVAALGLDFGAVDIMCDPSDEQAAFVVLEVNTAPSLSPLALTKYVKFINGGESENAE